MDWQYRELLCGALGFLALFVVAGGPATLLILHRAGVV